MISALYGNSSSAPDNQSWNDSTIQAAPVVRYFSHEIPLSCFKSRQTCAERTVVIPVGRNTRSVSPRSFEVPRILRNERLLMLAHPSVDPTNPCISSETSESDSPAAEKPAKKAKTRRSPAKHIDPIPITEREVITFMEAAAIGPKTENALRHLAFMVSAYEKLDFEGKPHLAKFAGCICRQPGQRRIYLNRQRLLAYYAWERGENV